MKKEKDECGAPWCHRSIVRPKNSDKPPSSFGRSFAGTILCRCCYQYVWNEAKKTGKSMLETYAQIRAPRDPLPLFAVNCARQGCDVKFRRNEKEGRRRIGMEIVCRNCYQAAWDHARKDNLDLEQALRQLPPR